MRVATLTHEILQPIRHVCQTSALDYVAIFTLRLTPTHGLLGVRFINEVQKPELEPWMVAAIERGVRMFVSEREAEGRPVGSLSVALAEIHVHPVDSRETAFIRAAIMAMTQAFQAYEILIDVEAETPNEP